MTASEKILRILLVEDNPGDARLFTELLSNFPTQKVHINNVTTIKEAILALDMEIYDVVILDLGLPDSKGFDTFNKLNNSWSEGPVIVLTGNQDDELGKTIVRMGAEDFLVKGKYDETLLIKSIGYAIERFNSKKIISKKEENFREIIEKNADGMIVTDEENGILFVNPVAEKILNEKNENLIGEKLPFDIEEERIIEEILFDKQGDRLILQIKVVSAFWDNLPAKIATFRDITDLKSNQENVNHLNKILKTIGSINHLIVTEKNREILLQTACELLTEGRNYNSAWIGLFDEDFVLSAVAHSNLSTKFEEFKNYISENNKLHCLEELNKSKNICRIKNPINNCENCPLKASYSSQGSIALKINHKSKTLGVIIVSLPEQYYYTKQEYDLLEEVAADLGLAIHSIDIEYREKKSQEKLLWVNEALKAAANSVVLTDPAGIIKWVNPAFTNLTGYSVDEAVGSSINILKSGKHDKMFYEDLWSTVCSGKIWNGELINKKKDGSLYTEEMTITPVKDIHGNINRFIAIKSDISDRKRYEEELIQAKNKAEKSDKLKSEFLAQMSHEIRTPLNAMLSTLDLVREDFKENLSEDSLELIDVIDGSGNRIIRTIESILNMSELQTDSYETLPQEVYLIKDVMDPVLDHYIEKFHSKNIKLYYNRPRTDIKLNADLYSLTKIIDHLVDNAYKYTEKGSVKISLNNSGKYILSIEDTGIGISNEYLENIYDPFSQEYQGYCRPYDGCGLGLAITKKYCELNNAQLTIQSERGKGTTVEVVFKNCLV